MKLKKNDRKNGWKIPFRTFIFNSFAVASLVGIGFLIFLEKKNMSDGSGWILFASSALCGFIGNLDRIDSIKLSRDGIEAKMREVDRIVDEAKSVLAELHKFAETAGATLINMLSASNRWGGLPPIDVEEERRRILDSLGSIGLDDETIKNVSVADKKWVAIEYADGIIKVLKKSPQCSPEQQQVLDDMSGLWNNEDYRPTPNELLKRIKQHKINDAAILTLIEDYKYYMKKGEHRRLDVWLNRRTWHP